MTNLFDIQCPQCGNTESLHVYMDAWGKWVYIGPYWTPEEEADAKKLYSALVIDLWERWLHTGQDWDLREEVDNTMQALPRELTWSFPVSCDACCHEGYFDDFDSDRLIRLRRLKTAQEHVHTAFSAAALGE